MASILPGERPLLVSGHAVALQTLLRKFGQRVSQPQRGFKSFAWFNQAVCHSHAQRLFAGDTAPCENQIESVALPDQTRQTDGSQINERNAKTAVEHAKNRIASGDAQVAP